MTLKNDNSHNSLHTFLFCDSMLDKKYTENSDFLKKKYPLKYKHSHHPKGLLHFPLL